MVTNLTDTLIEEGAALLRKLDASGPHIDAAIWLLDSESKTWTLYFSLQRHASTGTRVFYKSVQRAFQREPKPVALRLEDIRAAQPGDTTIAMLRAMVRIGGVSQVRLTNNYFNGILIADALVYRS